MGHSFCFVRLFFTFCGMLLLIGRRLVYGLMAMWNYNAIHWITSWKMVISMHDTHRNVCLFVFCVYTSIQGTYTWCYYGLRFWCVYVFVTADEWLSVFTLDEMSNWNATTIQIQTERHRLDKTHGTHLHVYTHMSNQIKQNTARAGT